MLEECLLDVAWVPRFAGYGDALAGAAADEDVAVCVHAADVAGVEPAVADHFCRFLGAAPIAEHEAAGDGDLAGLADRHFATARVEDADFAVGERRPAGEELLIG